VCGATTLTRTAGPTDARPLVLTEDHGNAQENRPIGLFLDYLGFALALIEAAPGSKQFHQAAWSRAVAQILQKPKGLEHIRELCHFIEQRRNPHKAVDYGGPISAPQNYMAAALKKLRETGKLNLD